MHKKFLIQAAPCNLALLLRSRYGSGKPRAAHDRAAEVILMILAVIKTVPGLFVSESTYFRPNDLGSCQIIMPSAGFTASRKSAGLDTGC